jgi:hypothetical protein
MNKNSIYREKILYYLNRNEDYRAMIVWLEEQPDLDQPDIFRELTAILKERYEKTGEKDWLEKANIIEEGIDQFEEEILDKKLHKALFMMQFDNVGSDADQAELFLFTAREGIIKSILSSPVNDKELWDLAHKIIKAEKSSGLYDPANWSAIFPL